MSGPFSRSPVTGELGVGDGWLRLRPGVLGLPVPSLLAPAAEIRPVVDLGAAGFERIGDRDPELPVPTVTALAADVWSRHDVDLVEGPDATRVAGAAFDDAHPDPWWTPIHTERRLTVLVGDPGPLNRETELSAEWMASVWIGILPLTLRSWGEGVGTARPDQM